MQLLGGIQAGLGLRPQRIHALPWAGPVELTQRGLEASQFVHLATVVINAPVEAVQLLGARLQLVDGGGVGAARIAAAAGDQRVLLRAETIDDRVAAGAGDVTDQRLQRPLQVSVRMAYLVVHVLTGSLLDPQQAGNAPIVVATGTAAGVAVPDQACQMVLCVFAIKGLASVGQGAPLGGEEALFEPIWRAGNGEVELDGRGHTRSVARAQVIDRAGLVALKEGRAEGGYQRRLASPVRSGEDIEARLQFLDGNGCPEHAHVLQGDALELHAADPAVLTPRMVVASRIRLSRARSPASPPMVWPARNSSIASAR